MIYDFEGHTPKLDPNSWVASNSVVIGKVELKKEGLNNKEIDKIISIYNFNQDQKKVASKLIKSSTR